MKELNTGKVVYTVLPQVGAAIVEACILVVQASTEASRGAGSLERQSLERQGSPPQSPTLVASALSIR